MSDRSDDDVIRVVVAVLAVLVLLPMLFALVVMPLFGMTAMWGMGGSAGVFPGLFFLMPLGGLLFLVAVAWALWRLFGDGGDDSALEELRLAYARGDIDEEEFERRRERLTDEE